MTLNELRKMSYDNLFWEKKGCKFSFDSQKSPPYFVKLSNSDLFTFQQYGIRRN